jgi:hypothetical protein
MPPEFWSALIRAGGPAIGGLLLAAVGGYGGQYAAMFKPPYDDYASLICLGAMAAGTVIAAIKIIMSSFAPSVIRSRSVDEPPA